MANPFALAVQRSGLTGPVSGVRMRAASYAGAQGGRLAMDWFLGTLSADHALGPELGTLRTRAQELVISNSTASRIPDLFVENVIGKDGILYQARVGNSRGGVNAGINKKLEDAWYAWGERDTCSVDGRRSWVDTESLITASEVRDGEVLIHLVRGFPNRFGFAVDVLDPAQLDPSFNRPAANGQNEIRMGVEVDRWGRAVAYHLWAHHPSEMRGQRDRQRVDARDIIHLYIQHRPRQTRGVTWFAPVIIDLKMLGGYREAELVAARTAASKMGWIQSREDAAPPMSPEQPSEPYIRMDADPGVIEQLPFGHEFVGWDPTHPTTAFRDFDKAIVRSIAVAVRVSYMSLSGDLSDTSYGSGRIGLLGERTVYERLQQRFIERVSTPIFRAWLEMALLSGAIQLDGYDASRYHAAAWHPRPFPWIDPVADVETAEAELALGIESYTRLAARKGLDYEEVLQERRRERELRTLYGEPEPSLGTQPQASAQDRGRSKPEPEDDDETEDEPTARARRPRLIAGGL